MQRIGRCTGNALTLGATVTTTASKSRLRGRSTIAPWRSCSTDVESDDTFGRFVPTAQGDPSVFSSEKHPEVSVLSLEARWPPPFTDLMPLSTGIDPLDENLAWFLDEAAAGIENSDSAQV